MSDTFQLLLTVLWLHTRETWLFHIMDALAPALWMVKSPTPNAHARAAEDATGATPRYHVRHAVLARLIKSRQSSLANSRST